MPQPARDGRRLEDGTMLGEFRDFLLRGNVVDLAVAVVIGAAFGAVVSQFVESLLTPLIAALFGEPNFAALDFTVNDSVFTYGLFLNAIVAFLLVAAAIFFVVVRPMNRLMATRRQQSESEGAPPLAEPEDVQLLREIRDLLREQRGQG